ncbi:MAG: type III pantothenate kinase [Pyrinomonadaceae bacterium]
MLLTIDIGNSKTKFGLFDNKLLIRKFAIDTVREQSADSIYQAVMTSIPEDLRGIVISSVVKELDGTYLDLARDLFFIEPMFIDHTLDFGFKINYFPPEDCGPDRLIEAFAAVGKFGAPCIVCAFGTATTIDLVNENSEYLGGIITPGIGTLSSALFDKTSKLPSVELERPDSVIGNSTKGSIQSGIYFGYIGLVDGIIRRMIAELNEKPPVVSTGGFAKLIAEDSEFVNNIEENLMLDGLRLIYEKTKG